MVPAYEHDAARARGRLALELWCARERCQRHACTWRGVVALAPWAIGLVADALHMGLQLLGLGHLMGDDCCPATLKLPNPARPHQKQCSRAAGTRQFSSSPVDYQ